MVLKASPEYDERFGTSLEGFDPQVVEIVAVL